MIKLARFGNLRTFKPVLNGQTFYLCLDRETLEYIGFKPDDIERAINSKEENGRLEVVVKYDLSSKWGPFIGVGKQGKH